jgi:hypothetical protein
VWYNIKRFFLISNCMIDDGIDVMNDVNEHCIYVGKSERRIK